MTTQNSRDRIDMRQCACLCAALLLALVPSHIAAETTLYKKKGDDVILKPNSSSVTGPISSIMWREGPNIAAQWRKSESEVIYYRHFKERGSLNTTNGAMTIKNLTLDDGAKFVLSVDDVQEAAIHLIVLSPVPVPMVTKSCDGEGGGCTLTCQGDLADVTLATYRWISDGTLTGSLKDLHITKNNSVDTKEFHCELENPVSQERSEPFANPFNTKTTPDDRKVNVNVGLMVFICLLISVLLLAVIHRCKAGMWFFQKASMPWESDFWTKEESPTREAPVVNGNTSHNETGQEDEETPMA